MIKFFEKLNSKEVVGEDMKITTEKSFIRVEDKKDADYEHICYNNDEFPQSCIRRKL